jgi:hypothetical protein
MAFATEMGSYFMIYVPDCIQNDPDIQKLMLGIHGHTGGMVTSSAYFYFFQNKESVLKIKHQF